MARQIALLRGINLGAHNRVPMPRLRELLGELGYEDVETVVQSGNIVLSSSLKAADLEKTLQQQIAAEFDVDTPVVVRTPAQLAKVVSENPLPDAVAAPKLFQVSFCTAKIGAAVARELESADLGDEQVAVRGREVYAFHANGIQKSPLVKLLTDKKLGVTATARNWNTVTKLLELA